MPIAQTAASVRDGEHCVVVAGTHAGKSGIVQDRNTSKTGHVTITVQQANGDRFKTLARNVAAKPARAKRKRLAPKARAASNASR